LLVFALVRVVNINVNRIAKWKLLGEIVLKTLSEWVTAANHEAATNLLFFNHLHEVTSARYQGDVISKFQDFLRTCPVACTGAAEALYKFALTAACGGDRSVPECDRPLTVYSAPSVLKKDADDQLINYLVATKPFGYRPASTGPANYLLVSNFGAPSRVAAEFDAAFDAFERERDAPFPARTLDELETELSKEIDALLKRLIPGQFGGDGLVSNGPSGFQVNQRRERPLQKAMHSSHFTVRPSRRIPRAIAPPAAPRGLWWVTHVASLKSTHKRLKAATAALPLVSREDFRSFYAMWLKTDTGLFDDRMTQHDNDPRCEATLLGEFYIGDQRPDFTEHLRRPTIFSKGYQDLFVATDVTPNGFGCTTRLSDATTGAAGGESGVDEAVILWRHLSNCKFRFRNFLYLRYEHRKGLSPPPLDRIRSLRNTATGAP